MKILVFSLIIVLLLRGTAVAFLPPGSIWLKHNNNILGRVESSTLSATTSFEQNGNGWQSALLSACVAGTIFLGSLQLAPTILPAYAAEEGGIIVMIEPCSKLVSSDTKAKNCVSTASVRQVDLYASPWTFVGSLSDEQVVERLQQALKEVEKHVEIVEVQPNGLRVQTIRNNGLAKDQVDFYVNRDDRVIQFVSRQVDGPDVNDFGANRKRLEEVRRRTPFGLMGIQETKKEGALGQLKAFYGLQSGAGFEGVLNDDDY